MGIIIQTVATTGRIEQSTLTTDGGDGVDISLAQVTIGAVGMELQIEPAEDVVH